MGKGAGPSGPLLVAAAAGLIEPELHHKRARATGITVTFATAVLILVALVKFPVKITQTGITEPAVKHVLHARAHALGHTH